MDEKNKWSPKYYNRKIEELDRKISGLRHRTDRMKAVLKKESDRQRKHRFIVWGSHMEYLLREMLHFEADDIEDLTDAERKAVLDRLFSDSSLAQLTHAEIRRILEGKHFPERQ